MSLVLVSLALALGAASPEVDAVLLTRRSGVTAPQGAELQAQLVHALEAEGVRVRLSGASLANALKKIGVKDATACGGRSECVRELIQQLEAKAVVSVSVSRVAGETAVALELVQPDAAGAVVKDSLLVPKGSTLDGLVTTFTTRLREALAPPAPKPAEPPPPVTPPTLLPTPKPVEPVVVTLPPPVERSHAGSAVLLVTGGVSLAAGVALVIAGAVARGELTRGATTLNGFQAVAGVDEPTALARNAEANVLTGVGAGAAALGAGLMLGGVFTW